MYPSENTSVTYYEDQSFENKVCSFIVGLTGSFLLFCIFYIMSENRMNQEINAGFNFRIGYALLFILIAISFPLVTEVSCTIQMSFISFGIFFILHNITTMKMIQYPNRILLQYHCITFPFLIIAVVLLLL
jgi:hypothetical protein